MKEHRPTTSASAKVALVITNDWEVYGDGSGDYFELQHRPLEALLGVIEEHGAKLTLMAEVAQQWAYQSIAEQQPWAREVAYSWEAMLQDTVRRNFDVQLHLHPQWLDAKCTDGRWQLCLENWSTAALHPSCLKAVLKRAKRYLEDLLQPVRSSYRCLAFRAGSYCIEPSKHVIEALLEAGIVCDTSVTKGMRDPLYFDYRDAFCHFQPWIVSAEDVKYRGDGTSGLLEMPICSYPSLDSPILRKLVSPRLFYLLFLGVSISHRDRQWLAAQRRMMLQKYPPGKRPFVTKRLRSPKWLLSNLLSRTAIQLDYDVLPPKVFLKCLHTVVERCRRAGLNGIPVPVVASGHTKNMHNPENLWRILEGVQRSLRGDVVYWTLSEAIQYWREAHPNDPLAARL